MRIIYPFFIMLVFYQGLTSCQKELSIENGTTNPPPPPSPVVIDSNYLAKMYFIDFGGTTIDTTDIWTYAYDNLKRVTNLTDSTPYDPIYPLSESFTYYYNGVDTLPFKSYHLLNNINNLDTIISYFIYNNTGQRIKDSIYHFSYNANFSPPVYGIVRTINKYTYVTNKIFGVSQDSLIYQINGNIGWGSFKDTILLDAKGNETNDKRYEPNANTLTYTYQFNYDSHASPFVRLTNFKARTIFPGGEAHLEEFPQQNNILTINGTSITGSPYSQNYNGYSYNVAGYPMQIFLPGTPPSTAYTKIVFVYRAL